MIHLSVGYVLGDYLCKRTSKLYPLILLLAVSSVWVMFIPNVHPIIGRFVSVRIDDVRYGSLIAMNILFFIPIMIMAMVSPYIIGLLSAHKRASGLSAGVVLFISTFGSFIGTNSTSFYLINIFPVSQIISGIGASCLMLSLTTLLLRLDNKLALK
jgi:hypothetical protein